MPTVRPSANTSILAPARCGVEPLRAHDGHQRDRLAALERVRRRREDLFVQTRTSIFAFCFSVVDEGLDLLLLLLIGQELLAPAA